jgi:hypothetical protein
MKIQAFQVKTLTRFKLLITVIKNLNSKPSLRILVY